MKMNDGELLSIIKAHRRESLGKEDGDLSNERSAALDHYHGRPYGDEKDGRSSVVSRDLSETVDWIMPQLMKVFLQSGAIAEFIPVGPEDEALAEQETDYVNHVIMSENPGFLVLHDWFKDALLLKNGYVKHYWDESKKTEEREWSGLTIDELMQLMASFESDDAEVEVVEQEEKVVSTPMGEVPIYDVRLKITRTARQVRIEPLPAEEVRISRDCRGSTQDSPFTEHVTRKTRSELIEMGMDREFVSTLAAVNEDEDDDIIRSRDSLSDESEDRLGMSWDRSMDEIEYCEAYIRVDWDDDGIAELRKVITVSDQLPDGDEWNEAIDCVAITTVVPKRVPHRHVGESIDDEVQDLQHIKTVLMRQMLDNIYLNNNQEKVINQRVHIPDMLESMPGGIKRVLDDQPVQGAVEYMAPPPVMNQILPAIDYIDKVKATRTGVNDSNTGMDPDVLKESTEGAYIESLARANQKIEMIARMLAEIGVKELVLRVHELLIKHQDKQKVVKLRGEYVPINPQEWRDRTDLKVRVGLGSGSEDERRKKLMLIVGFQEKLAQMGLVGPQQGYNSFTDTLEVMGIPNPDKYVLDPQSPEFQQMQQQQQQGQSNPLAEAEQVKAQAKLQSDQMQSQMKMQIAQMQESHKAQMMQMQESHKHQMEVMRMQMDFNNSERDRQSREAVETAKLEVKAMIEGFNADLGDPGIGAGLQDGH
jgi:hypothetical protein